jgi:phosphate-selective porin OprO/OprP
LGLVIVLHCAIACAQRPAFEFTPEDLDYVSDDDSEEEDDADSSQPVLRLVSPTGKRLATPDDQRPPPLPPGTLSDDDTAQVGNSSATPNASFVRVARRPSQPSDIMTDEPFPEADPTAVKTSFLEGLKWETEDGEYRLQFHSESQLDMRAYAQDHVQDVNQFGYYLPRMRMIFNGNLTEPIEYNISINKGMGSLDLLDVYLNFNYDSRLQVRFGRYRVPFTYNWYALNNQFLVTPERSVFATNYGYNRNVAGMIHGEIFDECVDYAVAVANGPRNSYFDTNASKDLLGYLNVRPFGQSEVFEQWKHLNVGGSFTNGVQEQGALPVDFHTSANATESTGTLEAVPSFLRLQSNVTESGLRRLGELHFALYQGGMSLIGAWDKGFNTYGFDNNPNRVRLSTVGYHIQIGYFITGEQVTRRFFVDPLSPFDLREGRRGCGAIELQARFDHFEVGQAVFDQGLADGNLWTNKVDTIDLGFNWYLNKYVKLDFDWQQALYARPVQSSNGGTDRRSDLFWFRTQVYF